MALILFSDVQKVLSAGQVVEHHSSSDLVEQLLLEVLRLIPEFLNLLGLLRQHVFLGLTVIISCRVHGLNQSRVLNLPLLVILLLEQLDLLLFEKLLGIVIFEFGALNEEEGFLETCSSLFSLIFELGIQGVVDHVSLMHSQLTCQAEEVADTLV